MEMRSGEVAVVAVGESELASTGAWDKYQTITVGTLRLPAGESKLVVRVKEKKGEAPCNLGEIRLDPVKR